MNACINKHLTRRLLHSIRVYHSFSCNDRICPLFRADADKYPPPPPRPLDYLLLLDAIKFDQRAVRKENAWLDAVVVNLHPWTL